MNLNRADLKKIIYDFNSISNRLMQADFNDYSSVLSKFVVFLKNNQIINDYIDDCGTCEQDLAQEFNKARSYNGRSIFSLGDTSEEEVRNVFAILSYSVENKINIPRGVAIGYSSSNKNQDKAKGFNDRVVMVLIRHIESYLTKIGIDMGIDEKIIYSITVQNGQVNIAHDNATITATNAIGIDTAQLAELVQAVRSTSNSLSPDDADMLNSNLEVVEEEAKSNKPKKNYLKIAINGLRILKGTAEFSAAVIALIQFIQPLL